MKVAFLAAVLFRCVAANAGAVQIGLLSDDELEKWKCGAPVTAEKSQSTFSCETAKYEETSSCPTLVVTNDSSEIVKVQLQVNGRGFEQMPKGSLLGRFDYGGEKECEERAIDQSCDSLAPGHSCSQEIDFSPEQSGASDGHLEVLVTGSGKPVSKAFDLVATAEYPPELLAVDTVIKRHRDELMRIPHVVRVSIDYFDNDIIEVEVAHEEDIPQIERSVPPKIEGYRVNVIEQMRRGWGM